MPSASSSVDDERRTGEALISRSYQSSDLITDVRGVLGLRQLLPAITVYVS